MRLDLADVSRPDLSVLVVTHGSWALTERALEAVVATTHVSYEVVIVDNCSRDETRARLAELTDARVMLNDDNRGFGPGTNQAAAGARGRYLVLLNTDAFVHPGWVEPMLEAIRQPGVGAVVPRYLHPDGSLQEAGVLLARDGSVLFHGDGDDRGGLGYRFQRVVDYGSAACLLIRRRTFEELGGFDEAYAPGYYEDADLCLRLAERGLAVVYEPRALVTHVRHGSGSPESAEGLSERNRGRFVERWGASLLGRPWSFIGAGRQAIFTARDARAWPRILLCARPADSRARWFAEQLLRTWPQARLSWAAPGSASWLSDHEPWLRLGVELINGQESSWLQSRLFHYDAAFIGGDVPPDMLAAVGATQPQAPQLSLGEVACSSSGDRLAEVLATAGVPSSARAATALERASQSG
jgi:O-antigen biosynthesis protein